MILTITAEFSMALTFTGITE